MALSGQQAERVARRELPVLVAELLDLGDGVRMSTHEHGVDLAIELPHGRRWVVEVKSSARTADVVSAARQARASAREGELPVVVVPYMGEAG